MLYPDGIMRPGGSAPSRPADDDLAVRTYQLAWVASSLADYLTDPAPESVRRGTSDGALGHRLLLAVAPATSAPWWLTLVAGNYFALVFGKRTAASDAAIQPAMLGYVGAGYRS